MYIYPVVFVAMLTCVAQDYTYTSYPMSKVAAAAVHLARQVLRPLSETVWTASLAMHSGYEEQELVEVVQCLQRLHWLMCHEKQELRAVMVKYDQPATLHVSRIVAISEKALRFAGYKLLASLIS